MNPDGKPGITMHIDNGAGTIMNPKTGARWGDLSQSNPLPHDEVLGTYAPGEEYVWDAFDALKKKHFAQARRRIFHYAVFAHRYGSTGEGSSGLSRGFGASDFIVSLGGFCPANLECGGTVDEQAGTFMHELGHNLDLRHGGDEHTNHKPNYLSIMSYRFQFPGLTRGGRDGHSRLFALLAGRHGRRHGHNRGPRRERAAGGRGLRIVWLSAGQR